MGKRRFYKGKKGIIRDTTTNLEWYVGPDKDTTWDEAKAWVDSLGEGWRLPTVKELRGLYANGTGTRNIDPVFKITGWWFWSVEKDSSSAWFVSFRTGYADYHARSPSYYGRVFLRALEDDVVDYLVIWAFSRRMKGF